MSKMTLGTDIWSPHLHTAEHTHCTCTHTHIKWQFKKVINMCRAHMVVHACNPRTGKAIAGDISNFES